MYTHGRHEKDGGVVARGLEKGTSGGHIATKATCETGVGIFFVFEFFLLLRDLQKHITR